MANEKKPTTEGVQAADPVIVAGEQKLGFSTLLLRYNSIILLGMLLTAGSFLSPRFVSYPNLVNVLRQQTNYIIITMGMMMCMASGGVDLALANLVGFGCIMTTEFLVVHNLPIWASLVAVLLCSAFVGAVSGWLVAYVGMPSFIITLCMGFNLTGVVYLVTRGANRELVPFGQTPTAAMKALISFGQENDPVIGLPWRFYLAFVMIIICWYVMNYTSFGRLMLATGSNPFAARLAGIDTRRFRMAGLMIVAISAGITGIIITTSTGMSAISTLNGDYTMIAMAASIIGGSSLEGGGGNVPFTVVGIFIMGLINNILNLMNFPVHPQNVVKAIVIILAIFLRRIIDRRT